MTEHLEVISLANGPGDWEVVMVPALCTEHWAIHNTSESGWFGITHRKTKWSAGMAYGIDAARRIVQQFEQHINASEIAIGNPGSIRPLREVAKSLLSDHYKMDGPLVRGEVPV